MQSSLKRLIKTLNSSSACKDNVLTYKSGKNLFNNCSIGKIEQLLNKKGGKKG